MKEEQIEKAALLFAGAGEFGECPYNPDAKSGFMAGAQWRINSVWHDREEQPEVGRWFIFKADDTNPFKKPTIKKIAYYTNRIENDKGLDWLKMVAEYKILCWAYVDDLLPERQEKME
jgi:hypothetical protein